MASLQFRSAIPAVAVGIDIPRRTGTRWIAWRIERPLLAESCLSLTTANDPFLPVRSVRFAVMEPAP